MEAIRVAHDGEGVVERLLVVQDRSCCGPSEVDILVLVLEHLFRLGGATRLDMYPSDNPRLRDP